MIHDAEDLNRRLPRATPESQGVDPEALRRLVEKLDDIPDVHSVMVLRHGHVVAEGWWHPFHPAELHLMFSVSKTFTALAVGLAVDEGLLTVDDRVVDLLPDDAPSEVSENLAAMRVRHLLTMTSGHDTDPLDPLRDDRARNGSSTTGPRWARAMLAAPVPHEPGTRFVYSTGSTYLVAAILQRLTGERLLDYLTPRLLDPLGITGVTWEQDPWGQDLGGTGMAATTEDLATLGQLLLRGGGEWQGRQLVPAQWVAEMSAAQVPKGPDEKVDWDRGYGFQLWRCRGEAFRADGAFGQFAVVWPEHDVVVALTAGAERTDVELESVFDMLDGAFGEPADDARSGDPLAFEGLVVALPEGTDTAAIEEVGLGAWFVLDDAEEGPLHLHSIAVRHGAGGAIELAWTVEPGGAEHVVTCGIGRWVTGEVELDGETAQVAAAAAWADDSTLRVHLLRRGTPYVLEVVVQIGGDAEGRWAEVAVDQNLSFGPTVLLRATGRGA